MTWRMVSATFGRFCPSGRFARRLTHIPRYMPPVAANSAQAELPFKLNLDFTVKLVRRILKFVFDEIRSEFSSISGPGGQFFTRHTRI